MNSKVQKFLDSLETQTHLDRALEAVVNSGPSECAHHLALYARSQSHDFSPDEAMSWLNHFKDSIHDSLLRTRFHRMRLGQCNDWAAFLALEREIKIDIPDEQFLGDRWGLCEREVDPLDRKSAVGFCRRLALLLHKQ
jgi:hypothetical protein